jgi:hypothetical protein
LRLYLLLQPDTTLSTEVVTAVNRLTDFILQYAVALAAVGALAMALIEAGKKIYDSRTKFQAKRWTAWMQRAVREEETAAKAGFEPTWTEWVRHTVAEERASTKAEAKESSDAPLAVGLLEAYAELLQLCSGVSAQESRVVADRLIRSDGRIPRWHAFSPDPSNALFALDLGRMMGSIQEAADVALANPRQFPSLYGVVTSGADRNDVRLWFKEGAPEMAEIAEKDPDGKKRKRIKEHADRFSRLRQIVKRRLDGFQLYTGDRWGSWNQFSANLLGFALMLGILVSMRMSDTGFQLPWWAIPVVSLFGGILSPIAKDLVSALKRVKDG